MNWVALAWAYSAKAPAAQPKTSSPGSKFGHVAADGLDGPGDVGAGNRVLRLAQPGREAHDERGPGHEDPVTDMDGRGVDADQDLVGPDLGPAHVRELQRLVGAVLVLNDCLHGWTPFALRCKVRQPRLYGVKSELSTPGWVAIGVERESMTTQTKRTQERAPLSRELVLQTALRLADQGGLESLSMRKLGQELGVEAMALYYHFANRDAIVDGIVDLVFGEVELPPTGPDWRTSMRTRAISLRDALLRHRWAIGLMESRRNPGPANLRHHDAVIGSLRAGGFDMDKVARAYSLLDSYIYGFAVTKMNLPFDDTSDIVELSETMLSPFAPGEYQNLADFITEVAMKPGYDYANEFENGLDAILDGLEREQESG